MRPAETLTDAPVHLLFVSTLVVRRHSSIFATRRLFRVAINIRIRSSSQGVIFLARHNNYRIRRLRTTHVSFIMNSIQRLNDDQVLFQVNDVSAVCANSFRRRVHFSLSAARKEAYIDHGGQVTDATQRGRGVTLFGRFSHAPFIVGLTSQFRASDDRRFNFRTLDSRNEARNRAISSHYRRPRLITFRAIRTFKDPTRTTGSITTAGRGSGLSARFNGFLSLHHVFIRAGFICAVLFASRGQFSTWFRRSAFMLDRVILVCLVIVPAGVRCFGSPTVTILCFDGAFWQSYAPAMAVLWRPPSAFIYGGRGRALVLLVLGAQEGRRSLVPGFCATVLFRQGRANYHVFSHGACGCFGGQGGASLPLILGGRGWDDGRLGAW